MRLENWL